MNNSNSFYCVENLKTPHAFTSRLGGHSLPPYDSFQLNFGNEHSGDAYQAILSNRQLLAEFLDANVKDFVACQQVHGNHIYPVKNEDRGRGALAYGDGIEATDALITNQRGIPLMVMVADCVPILLSDPVQGVIAAIHAGWRGTAKLILKNTLKKMQQDYGSKPEDIQVAIGPSIGQCCFEVDYPVVDNFKEQIDITNPKLIEARGSKYFPDLKQINRIQALQASIVEEHIQIINLCTYCNQQFFSYRREKGITGRLVGAIVLTP